jgi:hypothetical protein
MKQKSSWLMAISVLFLAATLVWAVPVCAQLKSGSLLKSYNQGLGTGGALSLEGKTMKSETSPENQFGSKNPGQFKSRTRSNNTTHTPAPRDHQPQSQTPGGTVIR